MIDPTANVLAKVEDAVRRLDDMLEAAVHRQDGDLASERRYNDLRDQGQKEMAALRADHAKDLAAKESSRLDSIRQVDREEVTKTAAQANLAIATLAKQTTDLAVTLQNTVQTTANTAEARRATDVGEINKRVSALELSSSASVGKSTVADPMMSEFITEMRSLVKAQATNAGKTEGISSTWAIMLAVVAAGSTVYALLK